MQATIGIALAGWVMGGLINYLADVLPARRRIVKPFCLNCQQEQPAWNYFAWPRRCAGCNSRRKPRVWLVEGIFSAASILLWLAPPQYFYFLPGWIFLAYLMLVTIIDLEHHLILHPVSVVGVVLSTMVGYLAHGWLATLLGGLAGFACMFAFYLFGRVFVRVIRRWNATADEEALGFGDVNLGAITGLALGWPGILAGLVVAILIAGGVALLYVTASLLRRNYRPAMVFPFGPTLAAAIVYLLYL